MHATHFALHAWRLPWRNRQTTSLKNEQQPCFPVTAQLVLNAVGNAQSAASNELESREQSSFEPDQGLQLKPTTFSRSSRTISGKDLHEINGNQPELAMLHHAYQQLCVSLLVYLMKRVLSANEADAWTLLEHYNADDGSGNGIPTATTLMQSSATESSTPCGDEEARCAEHMDDDECVYEDMDPGASGTECGNAANMSSSRNSGLYMQCTRALSHTENSSKTYEGEASHSTVPLADDRWAALRTKILHIGRQVSYGCVSDPHVWSDPSTLSTLLELLRALGVHACAHDLQPLLHLYVGLLADHLAKSPSDLVCLPQLWQALGVSALTAAPSTRARSLHAALPPDAAAALSLVGSVAAALAPPTGSASARLMLWRQLCKCEALSLSARVLSDVGALDPSPENAAALATVTNMLLFYVFERPGGVDAAQQLLDAGCVRALSVLLPKYQAAAGEPLRLLAVTVAGCNLSVARWVLSVPAVQGWLAEATADTGGLLAVHGALWRWLAGSASLPASCASKIGSVGPGRLLEVLQSAHGRINQLFAVLSIMHAMQRASDARLKWDSVIEARLLSLSSELRTCSSAVQNLDATCDDAEPSPMQAELHDDDFGTSKRKSDPAVLLARQDARMVPECLRIIKSIINTAGKTD
eukprot:303980-Chlamydomonas_euryale.AAC.14